ncbi:nucleotidyltransferase family protein [Methanobrevibacter sp.]|uniref:nucleotidyltransferase family protein n=1 Tax=Methanobrevibacter sp. TaxID=66852 RepID=UPI00388FF212
MTYTIEEIKKRVIPIVREYGVISFSLFGSYAKGTADEDSDLDFVMDKGNLNGLIQYVSLVNDLEKEFGCHVDLISKGSSNKEFLSSIRNDEVLLYEQER